MKKLNRGWWVAFVLAPVAMMADSSAHAQAADPEATSAAPALPHGIHVRADGSYTQDVCDHAAGAYCLSQRILPDSYRPGDVVPEVGPFATTPPANTMTPADVLAAYSIPSSSKAGGRIVAIVDANDQYALADLNVYRKQYGIPPLAYCTGSGLPNPAGGTPCFASVDDKGGNINKSIGDVPADDTETSLDMDMISAVCPDCSILLVQIPSLGAFGTGAKEAVKLGASAVSISIGGPEGAGDGTGYSMPGSVVLAASGDSDYLLGGKTPSFPASAPDILGVGGTTLTKGTGYTEAVWNVGHNEGAGSGCSTVFPMPAYQTAYGDTKFGGCSKRAVSDLSAAADFSNGKGGGIAEYCTHGGWGAVVGTSAASPLVAAILTRLHLTDSVSKDFGFIYTHPTAFNDVTSGNNNGTKSCTTNMCVAGPGWDGPTGIGTPNGAKLAPLGGGSGSSSGSSSGGGSGSSSGSKADGGSGSGSGGGSGSGSGGGSGSGSGGSGSGGGSGGIGSSSGGSSGSGSGGSQADASAEVDGGGDDATTGNNNNEALGAPASGCGCFLASSSESSSTGGLLALGGLALAFGARRRRQS